MWTLGSLFDGAGTCPFAAQQYGIKTLWTSEIEPFPLSVTRKQFPDAKQLGDISKINGSDIESADIISFGSPCQDLSVAGKREGLSGERSGLFMEAVRIIKEMRDGTNGEYPKIAIWENVPGAFSSNKGEDFRVVLDKLCEIKGRNAAIPQPKKWSNAGLILADGYSIAWRVLDAQFWGVPQRRRRIFLVVDFGGGGAGQILFEREGLPRHFAESRAAWKGFTRSIKGCSDAKVWDARGNGDGSISPTIIGDHNNRVTDYSAVCVETNDPVHCYPLDRASFNQGINAQYDIGIDDSGIAHTLVAKGPGAVAYGIDCRNGTESQELSATLQAHASGGYSLNCTHPIRLGMKVRRLTPTECARLQGMPDWWCEDVPHSDSAEYKMWGNGMALPCVMYVFEGVRNLLRSRWLDKLLK